jgi:CHAT domain-containing protein
MKWTVSSLGPSYFLNACEMGFINPLKFSTLVRFFLERGARTIVAPDCKVNDLKSARFSQLFYKHLVRGASVMEALFKARQEMRQKHNDFVGYAYALYGQADARLVKEASST